MKFTICFLIWVIALTGCSKNDMTTVKYNAEIDSNFYFTLILKGSTYSTYGIYEKNSNDLTFLKPAISFSSVPDDNGENTWTSRITVYPFEYTNSEPWRSGNCSADILVSNHGNQLGTYKLVKVAPTKNQFYNIDHNSYLLDSTDTEFTIVSISRLGIVEGSFNCMVRDSKQPGSDPIPAKGSFRLLKQ